MDHLEQLREAATLLLRRAGDAPVPELASAIEKATGVLRLASDTERSQAELRTLELQERKLAYENRTASKRERSERIKEYVSIITPAITIITLAATLIAQNWQFVRSEQDKSDAAQEARWEDTVKAISDATHLPPGIGALHPFLSSPRYAERARLTALQLIATNTDPVFFDDLFGAVFVPVDSHNVPYIVRMSRAFNTKVNPLLVKSWNSQINDNDLSKLSDQEQLLYSYIMHAVPQVSSEFGTYIKTARGPSPDAAAPNLSATYFKDADWTGGDLRGANIENVNWAWLNLRGADLSKISQFAGATMYGTAWWQARAVSPELLAYLTEHSGWESNSSYGPAGEKVPEADYAAALGRLRSAKE